MLVATCGDGIVDVNSRESCDDGTANADDPNARCRSNCQLAHCGDGIKNGDEICDDGNVLSGDNCSFDCQSTETCGNGYIDFARGEQCDNNVKLASDGCGERCELETQLAEASPTLVPATVGCDVEFPTRGEHIFLLANGNTQVLGRLGIQPRLTAHAPPARSHCSMAYDPILDRVFMFGGVTQNVFDDLWMFDGTDWSLVNVNGPAARYGAGLVYETHRQRLLLFAGRDYDGTHRRDTWAFVNNQWLELDAPSVGLAPMKIANWIYSEAEQRVLVLTAQANMQRFVDDHWEVDERPCEIINGEMYCYPTVGMFARSRGTIAALPDGTVVLFGGVQGQCNAPEGFCSEVSVYFRRDGQWRQSTNGFHGNDYITHLEDGILRAYPASFEPGKAVAVQINNDRVDFIQPETRVGLAGDFSAYLPHLGATLHWGGAYISDFSITLANSTWLHRGGSWQQGPQMNRFYCSDGVYLEHERRLAIPCSSENVFGPRQLMYTDGTTVVAGPLLPDSNGVFGYDPQRKRLIRATEGQLEALSGDTWVAVATTNALPTTINKLLHFRGEVYAATLAPVAMYVLRNNRWQTIDTSAFAGLVAEQLAVDPVRNHIVASISRNSAIQAATLVYNGTAWRQELYAGEPLVVANYDAAMAALRPHPINPEKMLVMRTFDPDRQRERCESASVDSDEDGAAGCADPDCWWRCDPTCAPTASVSTCAADRPRCGDNVCSAPIENPAICPSDCAVYAPGW